MTVSPLLFHWRCCCFSSDGGGNQGEDFVGQAEEDFWAMVAQEQKAIDAKEQKRKEALLPKNQPTPIPEEGAEGSAEETKVRQLRKVLFIVGLSVFFSVLICRMPQRPDDCE